MQPSPTSPVSLPGNSLPEDPMVPAESNSPEDPTSQLSQEQQDRVGRLRELFDPLVWETFVAETKRIRMEILEDASLHHVHGKDPGPLLAMAHALELFTSGRFAFRVAQEYGGVERIRDPHAAARVPLDRFNDPPAMPTDSEGRGPVRE